jgi:hypothetical protein
VELKILVQKALADSFCPTRTAFAILEEVIPDRAGAEGKASPKTGRPGMAQWTILVLGVLRLGAVLKEREARRRGPYKKAA